MHSLLTDELSNELAAKLANIKLLTLDVDGVMTNGSVFFTALGDEIKAFNILDGQGIKSLLVNQIEVAIITGRTSALTEKRAQDLGIKHIIQGREDKKTALLELCEKLTFSPQQEAAYVGDDLPDLSAIKLAHVGFTVPNAHPFIKKHADHCTTLGGGKGAVREICDLILHAKGLKDEYYNAYLG